MHLPRLPRLPRRFLLWAACAALSTAASAQRIVTNASQPVLAGDPIVLQLAELKPGQTVQLQAERVVRTFTGEVKRFASAAQFLADERGGVDLARQAPLAGGSYEGVDGLGLLWSMKPIDGGAKGQPFNHITLTLRDAAGQTLAEAALTLRNALPEVQTRPAGEFPGARWAVLPGAVKRPALILLGGSEGGSAIVRDAAPWASRGYAVLALPYYSPSQWGPNGPMPAELPALPAHFFHIPLERLQAARDWLAQQPEVDATRIGVMGTSKGAEFALLAAVRMPWIQAVAAMVPTDVTWEGWGQGPGAPATGASFSWQGEPLPHLRYKEFPEEFQNMMRGQPVHIRRPHDKGRAAATPEARAAARIPVERIQAPVFLAGGGDDQLWASGDMTATMAATREKAGLRTVALVFPEAGHFLGGTGTGPTTHYNDGLMKNGGTPRANAHAQAATHAALLKFFAEVLKP